VQTSAIAYRVVDFLKAYPPFQAMDEADLLDLVSGGRVRFHESEEYVYWQGNSYDGFFFVIQQGSVSLWERDGTEGERLRDVRGPGDLLGIDRFLGAERHLYSARAESDILLYALPAKAFANLLAKSPAASRYLEAHASVSAYYEPPDQMRRVHRIHVYEAVRQREPLCCAPSDSMAEASRRMEVSGRTAIAVVGASGTVDGILTAPDVLRWLGTGSAAPGEVAVGTLVSPISRALAPDASAATCVLAMLEAGRGALAVTEGGHPEGRLLAVVTAEDLGPAFGEQPLQLLREITHAPDLGALRTGNQRARRLFADRLISPSSVDWLAQLAARIDTAVISRAAELAGVDLGGSEGEDCWFLFGASGRGESLTALLPRLGVVLGGDEAGGIRDYRRVHGALCQAGYYGSDVPESDLEFRCASAERWRDRYRAWVRDPVRNRIYEGRPLFDIQPVAGRTAMVDALRTLVREEVAEYPGFLRLLAHDCLANLPPLAFFEDLVVDEAGERSDTFQLERSALRPLVDVGRVFGIAGGCVLAGSTIERLGLARRELPDHEAVFREAGEAFRLMLFHQSRAGLRRGHGGTEIPPADLSHHERRVLKSGFRAIARLVQFAGEGAWIGQEV